MYQLHVNLDSQFYKSLPDINQTTKYHQYKKVDEERQEG